MEWTGTSAPHLPILFPAMTALHPASLQPPARNQTPLLQPTSLAKLPLPRVGLLPILSDGHFAVVYPFFVSHLIQPQPTSPDGLHLISHNNANDNKQLHQPLTIWLVRSFSMKLPCSIRPASSGPLFQGHWMPCVWCRCRTRAPQPRS